ncbi:hypothetical protein CISG_08355 [Coccidioides immitis RMSCC 3703]|uniref:Subtelomeric hrmA-associated cluster protein AFUB-079030/YDR124W-like helical bundle domain-containing protein n=2 Tax=Coccidioides immitis TaxID=5501 RepID=A0A0J8R559_COCIT|nr:hypothetical protein CIRG_02953 [Coccidioides immitis RMSCC 2394]KMU80249.1 hypothetical protein CISG_08355 [Coccidioides immitis RMSCC 3703]
MVVLLTEASRLRSKHPDICPSESKEIESLADGYFSWVTPSPISRNPELPSIPYTHFALIAIDGRGCVRYHTSQSLERHCRYIFTPDLKERFIQATGTYARPQRIEAQPKRRRLDLEEIPDASFETVDRIPLKIGEEDKILDYYESAFRAFQQINCRQIAKAFIKIIEPRKQVKHPYNGGRGASGEKGDPEKTKPDWWPAGVIHREPDHLKKPERIRLLVHIIRNLRKSHNITADKLEEAGRDVKRQIKPRERWDILEEIYAVRRMEESYERDEIGEPSDGNSYMNRRWLTLTSDADAVVYVINRDSTARSERDSECLSDSGHVSHKESYLDNFNGYARMEDTKPGIKYPVQEFVPSPVEQIGNPVTTDPWSIPQSSFYPVGYEAAPASIGVQQQQALPQPLTPTTTTPDMHMRMQSNFDFMPLGAPSFQPGSLGHPHLLHHEADESITHYK